MSAKSELVEVKNNSGRPEKQRLISAKLKIKLKQKYKEMERMKVSI